MTKRNRLTMASLAVTTCAACGTGPTPPPQTASVSGSAGEAPISEAPVERPAQAFKFDTITPFLKFSDAYGERA